VVDASVIAAALVREDHTEFARELLPRLLDDGTGGPPLLWQEVANVMRTRVRRGLSTAPEKTALLHRFLGLGLEADAASPSTTLPGVIALSDRHGLTVYDAAYLELALRIGADLATLDQPLAEAARREGVVVHTP